MYYKKPNKEKVKYITKVEGMDINIPRYNFKDEESQFVKKYYGVFSTLIGLNPCARDLIEYLTEIMNSDNIVRSDDYTRKEFIKQIEEISFKTTGEKVTYSDSNIKKAFSILNERRCLIKLTKGLYKVNPEYYFKKDEKKRLYAIKVVLEFERGIRNFNMDLLYSLEEPLEEYNKTEK